MLCLMAHMQLLHRTLLYRILHHHPLPPLLRWLTCPPCPPPAPLHCRPPHTYSQRILLSHPCCGVCSSTMTRCPLPQRLPACRQRTVVAARVPPAIIAHSSSRACVRARLT